MATKKMHFRLKGRQYKGNANLMRLADYAKSQNVDPSTVRNWIAKRKLIGYKFRGRWWVDPESLNRVPLYEGKLSNPN